MVDNYFLVFLQFIQKFNILQNNFSCRIFHKKKTLAAESSQLHSKFSLRHCDYANTTHFSR
jgi:hypothetical protein